jgi:S-adenosylmethionine synthetase
MPETALITGATGLLGRQVVKAFERAGYNVVGTGFSRATPPKIRKVDIQDADEVAKLFTETKYEKARSELSLCANDSDLHS